MGVVDSDGQRWRVTVHDLHVPSDSPFVSQHHANWRQYALLRMAERGASATHYTSLLGISRVDYERLREKVLQLVVETRSIALASKEEDLFCMSLDLFPV